MDTKVQQGGLKACSSAAVDEDGYSVRYIHSYPICALIVCMYCMYLCIYVCMQKTCRLECAHAVAKTLVTTNPNVLSEHLKLGAIKPLLFLCK